MGTLTTTVEPKKEPVSLEEAKRSLGVTEDDDDSRIVGYIKAARKYAEAFCNIRIMTQTVELTLDYWPSSIILLGTWPIQSVVSLKYFDTASPSVEQTLVADVDYYADVTTIQGRINSISGWPSVACKPNAITITMTAGYSSSDLVPENLKDGIKAFIGYLYECDPEMKSIAETMFWPNKII